MSRTAVNRALLALIGLFLFAGGALLLIGGLDLNRHWHLGLPNHWTITDPHHAALATADRTRWTDATWWWPALLAALASGAALALWWLLAQLAHARVAHVDVPGAQDPPVRLRGDALAGAIAEGTEQLPGVTRARVRVLGRPRRPHLAIALTLAPGASPDPVLRQLAQGPLPDARTATALVTLPAHVRIRADPHPASRVR